MTRWATIVGLCLVVMALAACGGTSETRVEVGYQPPPLKLPDVDGREVSLADFRGQVVLLNFWALWCEPCKAEMPEFQDALDHYGPQGLAVVSVDLGDRPDKVKDYISGQGYTFTVLVDRSLETSQAYDARILPLNLILDRQGTIRSLRAAPFQPGELLAEVEAILAEEDR